MSESAPAPLLMLQGTASSVGNSVLTAAFCRILLQDGYRVEPFKAQNMSNNADVTPDGLEIGRAQSQQAAAAGFAPRVEMNPVLIKPQGDRTAQLVIDGRPAGTLNAKDYLKRRDRIWPSVERSLAILRAEFDVVVAEGAGSPAEPNLRPADVVNMELALHAASDGLASVLIVGDIDRGGVFAHLVGTMELLAPNERDLVRGFLINRFRGDPSLLDTALIDLEQRTGVPVLGVIPWIDDLGLAEEDGVALERPPNQPDPAQPLAPTDLDLVVIRLPRIANFDVFDPLTREPGVRLRYVDDPAQLGSPDCLILPGTKATIADLAFLRERGLADAIQQYAAAGGTVIGICGGYQMLGRALIDESGVEGPARARVDGLSLLPVETHFHETKRIQQVHGTVVASAGPWSTATTSTVTGYEIHMGRTAPVDGATLDPLLRLDGGSADSPPNDPQSAPHDDGAPSPNGRIAGTYCHGLFHNDALRVAFLQGLRNTRTPTQSPAPATTHSEHEAREAAFDRLAQIVRDNVDVDRIKAMIAPTH